MRAIKSMDLRDRFGAYCDQAINGEVLIVSRPKNQNVVIISEKAYNELLRTQRNLEYLEKIDRSRSQMDNGETINVSISDLEAME